jgi:hypothetical protein
VQGAGLTAGEPGPAGPRALHEVGTRPAEAAPGPVPAGARSDAGQAITAVYGAQYCSLVRLAAVLVGDAGTAEEVVQDSFIATCGAWSRLRDRDKALAYLRQSVVKVAVGPAAPDGGRPDRAQARAGHAQRRPGRDHPTGALGSDLGQVHAVGQAARGAGAPVLPGSLRTAGRVGHGDQPGCGEVPHGPGQGGPAERPMGMYAPKSSSTSCEQAIFVDQAIDTGLFDDAVLIETGRRWILR